MGKSKIAEIRSLALLILLSPAWANATAGAGNGFRRIPDVLASIPSSLTVTRTQVLVTTSEGLFIRPVGGSPWSRSLDAGPWKNVLPLLPNGDTLLVEKDPSAQAADPLLLSTNGGKSWASVQCPGDPLLLCRSGFFCRGMVAGEDVGIEWSRDLGKTWAKLTADTVYTLAVWKNGIAGVDGSGKVFKIDVATRVRTPLISGLPPYDSSSLSNDLYTLFNVGDSLFAWSDLGDRLFKCQAGDERWIPVWEDAGHRSLFVGASYFGITRGMGDSLFWSRDYGKTWRPYPQPPSLLYGASSVPEANRVWALTNPLQRIDAGGTSWVMDVVGMPGVQPSDLASNGKQLFANSFEIFGRAFGVWFQSVSPDSAWEPEREPEGMVANLFASGHSIILQLQNGNQSNLLRIDPDGRRTVYPDPGVVIGYAFAGSRGRLYLSTVTQWRTQYYPGPLKVALPTDQTWRVIDPAAAAIGSQITWFAMDSDRVVSGSSSSPFYSQDGGDTWDTCPMPGSPRVNGMVFTGGAFLGFTSDGLYRSSDPQAGWKGTGFQGDPIEMLAASGDTLVARDASRLLLTVDGSRTWSSVEPPYAPKAIKRAALAWGSICLIDSGYTDSLGILCGSLSGLSMKQVDGINLVSDRAVTIPKLQLRWGRIEGVLPGRRGPEVSAGVDGRIRPTLRTRLP